MEIKLINDDCLNAMQKIPNKSIDMILCDLPYGVTENEWDNIIPFDKLWNQYERIIKDNAAIVLFAQGKFYVELVNSNLKLFRYDFVWDKISVTGFLNANKAPLRRHEQIAVFYKHLPTYNVGFDIGKYEVTENIRYNENWRTWKETKPIIKAQGKYPTSILKFARPNKQRFHPTQKPDELLEFLLKTYTNENDLVLDNCMGSGSTGVACALTNRNFIGIEADKKYFNIAQKRISAVMPTVEVCCV